jgi:hypothetical protein
MRKGHTKRGPIGETDNGQQSTTRPISSLIPFQKLDVGKDGKKRTPSTKPVSREEREEREERTLRQAPIERKKKVHHGQRYGARSVDANQGSSKNGVSVL